MTHPRCPITYALIEGDDAAPYSRAGLRRLHRNLQHLADLPLAASELRREAAHRAGKMSVQGVQPKLSAVLRVKQGAFEIVDSGGHWILKPQAEVFPSLPENEGLTMRLAASAKIDVPVHGLVRAVDGSWVYFIERFDRIGRRRKAALEDFAQLSGATRDTKYDSSMEHVAKIVDRYTTFPRVESIKLLRRTLFCFLVGNEDMHLKNFSLLTRDRIRVELSPAYDLLNSTIALRQPREELALPLRGRKRRLARLDLVDYFGRERLGLNESVVAGVLDDLRDAQSEWDDLIDASFLPKDQKGAYREVLDDRRSRLFGS